MTRPAKIFQPEEDEQPFTLPLTQAQPDPQACFDLGVISSRQGQAAEAADFFRQALEADPENAAAHFNLGVSLQKLGRLDEAAVSYQNALLINPLDTDTLFNLGLTLQEMGLLADAEKCFQYVLEIDSDCHEAHGRMGMVYALQGETGKAIAAYQQAVATGINGEANRHMLAALTGQATAAAPRQYVTALFDDYSSSFESSLLGIGYQVPALLRKALDALPDSPPARFASVVDLGCGTGLSGLAFRDIAGQLHGVDLSAGMLAKAHEKGIYDTLTQGEIVEFLNQSTEQFDLFILTDVFVYLGELTPLFYAMRQRAKNGTRLLFSTELCPDDVDYLLQPTGRYAHSQRHIKALAEEHGFSVARVQPVGIRKNKEQWDQGEIYILAG